MHLVFVGPPGAGKGTQCARLARWLNVPHLSTGEMLREAVRQHTPAGIAFEPCMQVGQFASDEIILQLIDERLAQPDCAAGVIFDGFPRTLVQAQAFDKRLEIAGTPLVAVLSLLVSDDELLRRMAQRCREDDQPQIFAERLQAFRRQTAPLLDYYQRRGLLETIEGERSPDQVFIDIQQIVTRRQGSLPAQG
jgi:adenylate kinase